MLNGEKCVRCRNYFRFEELSPGPGGYGLCHDCVLKIDPNEKKRPCPDDGCEMKKVVIDNLVLIDRCETCGGVWLDADEIRVLNEVAARKEHAGDFTLLWSTLLLN